MLIKPENDVLDKIWIVLPFRSTNFVVGEILSLGTWVKLESARQVDCGSVQSIVGRIDSASSETMYVYLLITFDNRL